MVMTIDVNAETKELSKVLKLAEGYLSCERIIIQNIIKQLDNDSTEESIISYLEKLSAFLGNKIKTQEPDEDCTNYRYALGLVDTLLKMPYWKSWMKTIDI